MTQWLPSLLGALPTALLIVVAAIVILSRRRRLARAAVGLGIGALAALALAVFLDLAWVLFLYDLVDDAGSNADVRSAAALRITGTVLQATAALLLVAGAVIRPPVHPRPDAPHGPSPAPPWTPPWAAQRGGAPAPQQPPWGQPPTTTPPAPPA